LRTGKSLEHDFSSSRVPKQKTAGCHQDQSGRKSCEEQRHRQELEGEIKAIKNPISEK